MDAVNLVLGKSGFILFTVGLVIGAVIPAFRNPRMGLSAHTTAVQCGIGLVAFAVFWPYFELPDRASEALTVSLIASSVLLVAGLCLAAIVGASRSLPIAGKSFAATEAKERAVSWLVVGSSLWMLLASGTVCVFAVLA